MNIKSERAKKIGKLGGRPFSEPAKKKDKKMLLALTQEQYEKLKKFSDSQNIKPQESLRRHIMGLKPIDKDKNKELAMIRGVFLKYRNWFSRDIWTMEERVEFKGMLTKAIKRIEKELK